MALSHNKLVFGMAPFVCFIPFPVHHHTDAGCPRRPRSVRKSINDMTGFNFGFGNLTVNLEIVHVAYRLGFTTLFFRNC